MDRKSAAEYRENFSGLVASITVILGFFIARRNLSNFSFGGLFVLLLR